MKIELRRIKRTAEVRCAEPVEVIDGQIWIDGQKVCDCAENATSALPEGEYLVGIVYCKQYKRKVLCLEASTRCEHCPQLDWVFYDTTLPCYCPMLKIGNGVYNRPDGSIIVGTHLVPGCLLRSKDAYDPLYQRIRKSIQRSNQVSLIISSI